MVTRHSEPGASTNLAEAVDGSSMISLQSPTFIPSHQVHHTTDGVMRYAPDLHSAPHTGTPLFSLDDLAELTRQEQAVQALASISGYSSAKNADVAVAETSDQVLLSTSQISKPSTKDSPMYATPTSAPSSISPGRETPFEESTLEDISQAALPSEAGPSRPSTATKVKVSHARKTAPGHIKRPPNAFILFRSHCCSPPRPNDEDFDAPGTPTAQQLSELGINDHRHISRIVSHLWKGLPKSHKKYWEDKALRKKLEHAAAHPDYRYKPTYRKPEEVRKRKHVMDVADVEAEKRACEQLASDLLVSSGVPKSDNEDLELNPQDLTPPHRSEFEQLSTFQNTPEGQNMYTRRETRATGVDEAGETEPREKWTIDTVRSALNKERVPPPPPPSTATRVRRKTQPRGSRKRTISNQTKSSESSGATTDFAVQFFNTRAGASSDEHKSQGDAFGQFNYMAQLDQIFLDRDALDARAQQRSGSHGSSLTAFPPVSLPSESSIYGQTSDRGDTFPASKFSGRIELPSASPFSFQQAGSHVTGPLSPRSLPQPQQYITSNNLDLDSIRSTPAHSESNPAYAPTLSSNFSFGAAATETPIQRRDSDFLLPVSGMKRRGTLERTEQNGNLMLISPVTSAFGETTRKFSLGRWELRPQDAPQAPIGPIPHQLRVQDVYELPEDILEMFEPDSSLQDFANQLDAIGQEIVQETRPVTSSLSPLGTNSAPSPSSSVSSEDPRPRTTGSNSSAEDAQLREMRMKPGFYGSTILTNDAKSAKANHSPFYVGKQPYFTEPHPAATSAHYFPPSNPHGFTQLADGRTQERLASQYPQGGPTLESPAFGNSFLPDAHRESLGAAERAAHAEPPSPRSHFGSSSNALHPTFISQWQSRRERGSDATIRGRTDSNGASEARRVALDILQRQLQQPELQVAQTAHLGQEGYEERGRKYFHLTAEQAKDPVLVDSLLQSGYGVSFDREPSST